MFLGRSNVERQANTYSCEGTSKKRPSRNKEADSDDVKDSAKTISHGCILD